MNIEKKFKILNIFFLIILIFILIDSFDQSFGYWLNNILPKFYLFTFGNPGEGWRSLVWSENGIIENLQVFFLFITILILIFFLKKISLNEKQKLLKIFLLIQILGLFYFLMEEISWGQQYINFKTPEYFNEINKQKEFNLHNISNVFNELPKSFVFLWCAFSIPLLSVVNIKNKNLHILIKPNKKLIQISLIILLFTLPNLIVSKLNLINYSELHIIEDGKFIGYDLKMFLTIVMSFNFFRLSELQELLFCYYFFWHTLFLKKLFNK